MRRAVATVCLSGLLSDKIDAASHAGFDAIELFEPDLIASELSAAAVRDLCAAKGLTVEMYQPFRDVEGTSQAQFAEAVRRAEETFLLMKELGTDLLLVCSNARPDAIDDDDLAVEQLRLLADAAALHGIRLAFEALAWGTHVNTWEHAWDLVERADRPNLGLCLDSFHVLVRSAHTSLVARLPPDKVFIVQLADAPKLDMGLLPWSRHFRLFPGEGNLPVAQLVTNLSRAGYDGVLSLEVFNDVYRQSDPWLTATAAMRSLRWVEALGRPAAEPIGWGKVTLASSRPDELLKAIEALGFSRSATADHWAREDMVLVVEPATDGRPDRIVGIELVYRDEASEGRPAVEGSGPSEESSGDSPLGIVWTAEVVPPPRVADTVTAPGMRLDHVTLSEPFERFHEAIGYLRSVVGLDVDHYDEDAGPFGFVRRVTLVSAAGPVTIGLVSSLLPRGTWGPSATSPQHVAFAVDDIVSVARSIESAGVSILSIPANYYADLRIRSALPVEVIESLQRHNIMCDIDETGQLLHFCTQMLGSMFIEVLQRTEAYSGRASGAGVRMAAHVAASRGASFLSPEIEPA